MIAQNNTLPYYEIPSEPASFTAGTVASRIIDGLGFRYYWATEGLRQQDLIYKPGPAARTSEETLRHIYEMSIMILNSITHTANVSQEGEQKQLAFIEMRRQTLENFKVASERLKKATNSDMKSFKLIFKNGSDITEYPFWNQLNGPIADCLWHIGQVVSFRRSSGNPFTEKANVFNGKVNP